MFTLAAAEIVERCRNGESVRDDGFFDSGGDGRSDAEEVWESTLLKSQREPEEKKLPYMAHLLANLAFNPEISAAMAHQMTKEAEYMTYRQFCILQLSVERERFKLRDESYRGQAGPVSKELYQILYEYHDLYNRGVDQLRRHCCVVSDRCQPGHLHTAGVRSRYILPDAPLLDTRWRSRAISGPSLLTKHSV